MVHSDLGHGGRSDDPIVLADAQRHVEQAQSVATQASQKAQALITQALIDFRREGPQEALIEARNAAAAFAAVPDPERSGQNQGAACLAIVVLGAGHGGRRRPTDGRLPVRSGPGLAAAARCRPGRLRGPHE